MTTAESIKEYSLDSVYWYSVPFWLTGLILNILNTVSNPYFSPVNFVSQESWKFHEVNCTNNSTKNKCHVSMKKWFSQFVLLEWPQSSYMEVVQMRIHFHTTFWHYLLVSSFVQNDKWFIRFLEALDCYVSTSWLQISLSW